MKGSLVSNGSMRRNSQFKLFAPLLVGLIAGLTLTWFYEPVNDFACIQKTIGNHDKKRFIKELTSSKLLEHPTGKPVHVKPKANNFNYDFRPYFVYSELGFRFQLVVGIQTSEANLKQYAVAINNTWLQDLPKVVFFTPYSKNNNFHEIYNVQLNLNVVQLPDIIDGESSSTEFSFRIMQYMKDHFINMYSWFMQVTDDVYINADNLIQFLHAQNSSKDAYMGYPIHTKSVPSISYCNEKAGVVLSRTTLLKLTITPSKPHDNFGAALGKSIYKNTGIDCTSNGNLNDLFVNKKDRSSDISIGSLKKLITLWPISSPRQFIEIHRKIVLWKLKESYNKAHLLQNSIRSLHEKLPEDVPEKTLHWPIGIPPPFKPSSRFEVIPWIYFDENNLYGLTDIEPVSSYTSAYKRDFNDIINIIKKHMTSKADNKNIQLKNGYRRLDPQRGLTFTWFGHSGLVGYFQYRAEYIMDVDSGHTDLRRMHLIRPFSKIEALSMPAATEQKGIHLVLPVLREDVGLYESFLQMYKRICLQTGENVVLLTVFINVRAGKFEGDERDDPFIQSKNLIARYKHSYMWAQLPWLQVGVKRPSSILIMDIVSMKLPSNALIFLVNMNTEFTTNFLNRCRVNVVNGIQVFFPIPFVEYSPSIVYENKQKPTFVEVHRDNGYWDHISEKLACFNNNDYKLQRMYRDDFLDENLTEEKNILSVFKESNLQIFRAVDSELRHRFVEKKCDKNSYSNCTKIVGERLASRAQLAQYLFKEDKLHAKKE